MNDALIFLLYLLVCAGVTYLVRMIPLVFFRKKITNVYVRSFLYYIPYAVLTVMTVPAIFYSTSSPISAVAGFAIAIVLAFFRRGLLTVAIGGVGAVLITEIIMTYI
jgi:branched-subunit amino acid transport protein